MNSTAVMVQRWLDQSDAIRSRLATHGPKLIARLMRQMTLREIARRSGLSPTYLSLVKNGAQVISPKAFVRLAKIEGRA